MQWDKQPEQVNPWCLIIGIGMVKVVKKIEIWMKGNIEVVIPKVN